MKLVEQLFDEAMARLKADGVMIEDTRVLRMAFYLGYMDGMHNITEISTPDRTRENETKFAVIVESMNHIANHMLTELGEGSES